MAVVVTDLAEQERRLQSEGVEITMPLREEPWGERLFQVTDPNGWSWSSSSGRSPHKGKTSAPRPHVRTDFSG